MQKQEISSLQILRGFAALAVVCHHAFRAVTVNRPSGFDFPESYISHSSIFVELGAIGVDLFFILSGFLMVYISKPYLERRKTAFDFLVSRAIRVWPLYCLVTVFICCSLLRNLPAGGSAFDLQPFRLLSLAFMPSFNEHGQLQPILGVGWTLNYETFFYLIFALSLTLRNTKLLPSLTAFIFSSYALGAILPEHSVAHDFLFNSVIFEFIIGAMIATAYGKNKFANTSEWVWLSLGVTTLFLFAKFPADSSFRLVTRGLPSAFIFIFLLLSDSKFSWPKIFLTIGNSSYSIYLMHIPVLYYVAPKVMIKLSKLGFSSVAAEIAALLAIASAVFIGIAGYFTLEKPLLRLAKFLQHKSKKPSPIKADTVLP